MLCVTVHCDGGARPNPGPAGTGAVVTDDSTGAVLAEISEPIGVATSNEAEYRALILALQKALAIGATRVAVRVDSELVVKQVSGDYRVKKAHLKPLHAEAMALLARFHGWTIEHVPRKQNTRADALADGAVQRARSGG